MIGPLLAIDAATYRGTVAIIEGRAVLAEGETAMRGVDEERLMPAVASTLRSAGMVVTDLAGIVCGAGPGSFTSLRIAASIGKALALGAGVPLYGLSSLLLLLGSQAASRPGAYLALLDAMRGDVFMARGEIQPDGMVRLVGPAELTGANEAALVAAGEGRTMVGPGCTPAWIPHARAVARVAGGMDALAAVDLASWEPAYGRLAEAQVQWERAHGRRLSA